jgi:hypothetical protein
MKSGTSKQIRKETSLGEGTRLPFIPLRDAMLCVDCEFLIPAANETCSVCGGRTLMDLAELLAVLVDKAACAPGKRGLAALSRSVLWAIDSRHSA